MRSLFPAFSHIYIEEEARAHRLTQEICAHFPKAQKIEIASYRALFNQGKQEWRSQKQSQKLILAVKHGKRVHPATEVLPQHSGAPLFYASPVINCVYDCEYCFLQAMYRSANMVVFVNEEDFFIDARSAAEERGGISLSVSYDCDLLGSERFIPWTSRWIEFSRQQSQLSVEVRTKSSNYSLISHLTPHANAILSWSLATETAWKRYEHHTASPSARIAAADRALKDGWRVRFCFDPVIPISGWREEYRSLIAQLSSRVPTAQIEDISVGVFRIGEDHFKNMRQRNPSLNLLQAPLTHANGIYSLDSDHEGEIAAEMKEMLNPYFAEEKIVIW